MKHGAWLIILFSDDESSYHNACVTHFHGLAVGCYGYERFLCVSGKVSTMATVPEEGPAIAVPRNSN